MLTREQTINNFLDQYGKELVIASTGKISRELWELRKKRGEKNNDFLMLGSMGCSMAIGLGLAMHTKKQVNVLIGDGSVLMKLGSIATIIQKKPKNLRIVVLNNNCHDSTGGQESSFEAIKSFVEKYCLVIDVEGGSRPDLGRPTDLPEQIKEKFYEKVLA